MSSIETSNQPENIYKVSRRIKKTEQTLYNALRSVSEDSLFVQEIRNLWKDLPLLANLRCGLWYAPEFDGTCYFKSTDGHNGNWAFNSTRLNLHVATLAAERGGCCIVDATRKGKRFPDSMSKTIPIWACVLNRALADFCTGCTNNTQLLFSKESAKQTGKCSQKDWDSSLHLPLWVSHVEKANIESQIENWVESLKSVGADLAALAKMIKKPFRPLWISQKTVIWLNEVPAFDDWPFTPLILVSASKPSLFTQRFTDSEFSWSYIAGAADDEESWARGLTPALFWKNSLEILSGGPGTCNGKVSDIVERDRVYRALRGLHAPQVRVKAGFQSCVELSGNSVGPLCSVNNGRFNEDMEDTAVGPEVRGSWPLICRESPKNMLGFHWIANTGLAVGNADCGSGDNIFQLVDCVINCGTSSSLASDKHKDSYLYLPIVGPKLDRHSLQKHLADAVSFSRKHLMSGSTVFIYCSDGEDISVCVCLAVLLSCFNAQGGLEDKLRLPIEVMKSDVRQRLIYLSSFNSSARPSRGSLS